jgi:hypothetical protein
VAEPFQHFVDDYLAYLYEAHPTSATLDGIHVHDDLLDDLSRTAIDTHSGALAGFARRLDAIPAAPLSPVDQVEHKIVRANIESRQFDTDRVRSWERDPHFYGQTLAASLASQAIFTFAPETDRARRLLSKLRQVPRLVRSRDNIRLAGHLREDRHRHLGGSSPSLDLPRAFSSLDDSTCWLADASTSHDRPGAYAQYLETEVRPKARHRWLRQEQFERKLLVDAPALLRQAPDHRRTRNGPGAGGIPPSPASSGSKAAEGQGRPAPGTSSPRCATR